MKRRRAHPVYYFDVLGGAVVLAIVVRAGAIAVDPALSWTSAMAVAVGGFLVTLAILVTSRSRGYRQATPWLAGWFAVTATLAVIVLFWPLHILLFGAATGAAGLALVAALILRQKPLSEPISTADWFKLAGVAVGVASALASIEIGLRLMPGILGERLRPVLAADRSAYGVPHDYIGYLHRPNGSTVVAGSDFKAVHRVDARGFRNPWPWPDRIRIAVVGDSVTFGYGVEAREAWPAIVAANLPGDPLVNLALIGGGPQQYLRVYETFGVELRPHLLLVGVFAGNDFWDARAFDAWLKSGVGGNYMVWRDFGRPGPLRLTLSDPIGGLRRLFDRFAYPALRSSRLFNLLGVARDGTAALSAWPAHVEFADGTQQVRLAPDDFHRRSQKAEETHPAFQLALSAFESIHALATSRGTRVLMVLLPSKEETYLPLLEDDPPDPSRALRRAFDQRGIEYLDLAPVFRERAAAGERLFFEVDGHPNRKGYELMARLVLAHLLEHGSQYGLTTPSRSVANVPNVSARIE